MTEEDIIFVKKLIESGVFLLIIIALLWGIYGGSQKGSDFFQMADVNLLFTAPMKPQSVLFFRLTFQMAALMLGSLYILFQIPNLVLNLGFSHQVIVSEIPGISIEVPAPNKIIISGPDKQQVGQFAAEVREKRPPEPYKGKGIRYAGEYVRRKEGKAGKK